MNEPTTPAGDGGEALPQQEMTATAAAALMAGWADDEDENPSPAPEQATEAPQEPDDGEQAEAAPDQTENEGEAEEQPEPEPQPEEPQPLEFERLSGDTKLRLRDGQEVTVGDLKKRWGDLQELEARKQEFDAQQRQFQQLASQAAQQAQYFQQIAPQAIQALQAQLPEVPPLPPRELAQTDPFAYNDQLAAHLAAKADHEAKTAQIQQIRQGQQMQSAEAQRQQAEQLQGYIAKQREELVRLAPDLRDEGKRREFASDFLSYGTKEYGFSEAELNQTYDARLVRMAKDAIAYRKLMAEKPKPAPSPKPATTAPVASPGRRVSAPEAQAQKREALVAKARNTGGSMRDIADLIATLD